MNNYEKIYWLTRLDALHGFLQTIAILSTSAIIVYGVFYLVIAEDDWSDDKVKTSQYSSTYGIYKKWAIGLLISSALLISFLPTQNEAILILAGGKTLNYVESDTTLQKLPYQTTQIISEYMDKKIKELETEKK